MKRKVYATRRERMTDQIMGFLAFPLVNVLLQIIVVMISQIIVWMRYSQRIDSQELTWVSDQARFVIQVLVVALPWLVNGILLVLAFRFRPELGVGYIAFIGIALTATVALSVLFVAACFVIIPLYLVIGDLAIWVFVFLIAAGLLGLIVFAIYVFRRWWSHENNSQ